MKVYTRGGDKGKTSLLGGARVEKSDIRINAYGTVDELNSYIGLLADQPVNQSRVEFLKEIQRILFTIGSHLAAGPEFSVDKLPPLSKGIEQVMEQEIDDMDKDLPQLRFFVLPGGHQSVSFCHIARTVSRRAERAIVALQQQESVEPVIITYMNRLSDYLFVLSRKMAHELNVAELPWKPEK